MPTQGNITTPTWTPPSDFDSLWGAEESEWIGTPALPTISSGGASGTDFFSSANQGVTFDPDSQAWNPGAAFGPGSTKYGGEWLGTGAGNLAEIWGSSTYGGDTGRQGPFSGDISDYNEWENTAFTSSSMGGYPVAMANKFDEYKSGVEGLINEYYGIPAGDWATKADTWAYKPTSWNDPGAGFDYDPGSAIGTEGYANYYQKYSGAVNEGDALNPSAVLSKDFYEQLRSGDFDTLLSAESTGSKVKDYLNARKASTAIYFGSEEGALDDWDPTSPFASATPMINVDGLNQPIELSAENFHKDAGNGKTYGEVAQEKYGSSKMGAYVNALGGLSSQMQAIGPIEEGDYAGLYKGQKGLLQGLFGSGDQTDPGANSALANARSTLMDTSSGFYNTEGFGEVALTNALSKSTLDAADADDQYSLIEQAASDSFFGTGDFTADDLVNAGFLDEDGNIPSGMSAEAGSATASDALDGESEFAYQLRAFLEAGDVDVATGESSFSIYEEAYDRAKESETEGMENIHKEFQDATEGISSKFSAGKSEIRSKMASQKGLRTGSVRRAAKQIKKDLKLSLGESSLKWGEGNEDLEKKFNDAITDMSASLVNSWDAAYGIGGTVDDAQVALDTTMGNIYGTHTDSEGNTVSNTAEDIQAFMEAPNGGVGSTIDGKTLLDPGDWGTAYNVYTDQKLGIFGNVQETEGYSFGLDGKPGGGDDELYDPANADPGRQGWVDTDFSQGGTTTEAGIDIPTQIVDREGEFSGGVYGQDSEYKAAYELAFGTLTPDLEGGADDSYEEQFGGITTGQFGDFATDAAEDTATISAQVPGAKATALQGIEQKFESDVEARNTFTAEHGDVESATMTQFNQHFTDVGSNTVQDQLNTFSQLLATEGNNYVTNVSTMLSDDIDLGTIMEQDYELVDGVWKIKESGGGGGGDTGGGSNTGLIGVVIWACYIFCWSDRRLKKNIKKIGDFNGLNLYKYNYLWSDKEYEGFMADEVIKVMPEAVMEYKNYMGVNYPMIYSCLGSKLGDRNECK